MKLWLVELPGAVPPLTFTTSAEQRDRWIEEGGATAVYEIDAVHVYPIDDGEVRPAKSM